MKVKALFLVFSLVLLPLVFAQEHHDMGHSGMDETLGVGVCPITGEAALSEVSYDYKDKTYYFCCSACIAEFKKDPQKYISKMKEFDLEAYQFGYQPDTIEVNQGDIVTLVVSSRDVTHSVYIKEYGVNVKAEKNKTTKVGFIAKKKGEFPILCSVYCGRGHHSMKGKLIVK